MLAPVENRAALLGPEKFKWWPDWRGKCCAIVACGPSAKKVGVAALRGKMPVLAIKEAAVDLCPWADAVYGCDAPWWRYRLGLPKFKGLKLRWDGNVCNDYPDVHGIAIENKELDRIIVAEPGKVGSGRNSGFQALNIAVQFGAVRILLIGFDMAGEHFYGRNNWAMANNPDTHNFKKWRSAFTLASSDLQRMGIEVFNASPISTLTCFPKKTIDVVLRDWNL